MDLLAGILSKFADQGWFQIVGEVTFMASALAAAMPDRWKIKADGKQRSWYKWLYGAVEFLAVNVFNAKSKTASQQITS